MDVCIVLKDDHADDGICKTGGGKKYTNACFICWATFTITNYEGWMEKTYKGEC